MITTSGTHAQAHTTTILRGEGAGSEEGAKGRGGKGGGGVEWSEVEWRKVAKSGVEWGGVGRGRL